MIVGESPDFATVKSAPLELYVAGPVKLSEAPFVKSMLTVRPSAGFAGQLGFVSGLQLVYVCAVAGSACRSMLAVVNIDRIEAFMLWMCSYGGAAMSKVKQTH
jgi:hypothetical protein